MGPELRIVTPGRPRRLAQRAGVVFTALALVLAPAVARAQQPQKPTSPVTKDQRAQILKALAGLDRDTLRLDSLQLDSLRIDSLRADTSHGAPVAVVPDSLRPAAPPLPNDSITRLLMGLKGYAGIKYSGADADFAADSSRIVLTGPAQVQQGQQSLAADSSVVYNQSKGEVCGNGHPVLTGGAETGASPVKSLRVCYDVQSKVGVALGARTQFTENADWYINGNIVTRGQTHVYGSGADFTTCNLNPPHYHFEAKELKVVRGDVLVARDVTMDFADVPVFWLPFMVQSLRRGRHSGLLMPQFSINDIVRTNPGWDRRISNIGFYWAINDYMDATVTGEWFSNHWTSLQGNINFNVLRAFLRGGLTFQQFWRVNNSQSLTLSTRSSWDPTERTHIEVSGNYASSSSFIAQNTWDPAELTRSIDSNVSATHRFDWGTLSLGGQRRQFLTDQHVDMTLPRVGINIASITLFGAPPSSAHWYNNMTISGSGSFQRSTTNVNQLLASSSLRDQSTTQGSMNTSLRLGSFSWSQSVSTTRNVLDAKPAVFDSTAGVDSTLAAIPRAEQQTVTWSTGLNYTQRLIGTSTFTPNLTLAGNLVQRDSLGPTFISAPVRLNFGATLKTDIYGFFPGFGPFSRLRHYISPSLTYTFSPRPQASPLAQRVFGTSSGMAQNRLTLQINQTFEAKYKSSSRPARRGVAGPGAAAATTGAAADTTGAAADTTGAAGDTITTDSTGLRHLPQSRKITLLSINTSAVTYDFVQARQTGEGLTTTQLTNTVSSGLLHGLSLTFTHDLFETVAGDSTTTAHPRFSPHLSSLRASFSITGNSWLFRMLGLGSRRSARSASQADTTGQSLPPEMQNPDMNTQLGMMGSYRGAGRVQRVQQGLGTWSASIDYSLLRPRIGTGNQQVNAMVSFQPTQNWNVRWQTGYSLTTHQFSNNILSLTRDLHRWQASLDFVKAQNGNFMFQFRVQLMDLPDLHLDYDQRGQPGQLGTTPGTPPAF